MGLLEEVNERLNTIEKKIDLFTKMIHEEFFDYKTASIYCKLSESILRRDIKLIKGNDHDTSKRKVIFTKDELDEYMNKYYT